MVSAMIFPYNPSWDLLLIHCSPGRWVATQELKLLIAYVTINYDIEPMEKRLQNVVFGEDTWPSHSARIRVRRRKQP